MENIKEFSYDFFQYILQLVIMGLSFALFRDFFSKGCFCIKVGMNTSMPRKCTFFSTRNNVLILNIFFNLFGIVSLFGNPVTDKVLLEPNIPIQTQIIKAKTIYYISDSFDLQGKELKIPNECELRFEGGQIKNGSIVFDQTKLSRPLFLNMRFKGSVTDAYFNIRDYGAVPKGENDCSILINDLINLKMSPISDCNPKTIYIPKGTYYIDNPIRLFAGWESPITLCGDGEMSIICQRSDNQYIIQLFEVNYVKGLNLTYKRRQGLENNKSVALACQRATFSMFENLTICKAHTAIGYISLDDQKRYSPTGIVQQCYVSCNFRNIRIYEFSNYAMDCRKEIPQGDSGSVYDNIYINSNDWVLQTNDNVSKGAIRLDNTVACFTQLNIEGYHFSSDLIKSEGMSRMSVQSLHIEGLSKMPSVISASVQSGISIDILDIQRCSISGNKYNIFKLKDSAKLNINQFLVRSDCSKDKNFVGNLYTPVGTYNNLKIGFVIDTPKIFK